MANVDGRKVEAALRKKGFTEESGDHRYFRLFVNGKDTGIYTKTSHNNQDIGDILISKMAKQLRMDKRFFQGFVDCAKTQEEYTQLLQKQNIITKFDL